MGHCRPQEGRTSTPRTRPRRGLLATIAVVILALSAFDYPAGAQIGSTTAAVAFTARLGAMAEASIAVDPANSRRLVAASNPYDRLARIRLATSDDGGTTWSPTMVLLPPGFAKSFDPVVFLDGKGAIVVVGGASAVGQPNCQPGSAVFIAVVNNGAVSYQLIRDARKDGAYVDRPGFALSRVDGRAYVTWTESTGPGASCRGTPIRSTVMIASGRPPEPFDTPVTLPTSGLPAPFGATPVVAADGTLLVAIGERDPDGRSRVTVTTSSDRARTFSPAEVVFDGLSPPTSIRAVSGFVAAVPSIAVHPSGRTAIAFVQSPGASGDSAGSRAVVFERSSGGTWLTISPPADSGTAELLPQVVYDRTGTMWLLSARAAGGFIDLTLRRRPSDWEEPINIARGRADRYLEIGQKLGFVATDGVVIAAAPLDRTTDSAMVVATHQVPAPPPPPPTTETVKAPPEQQVAAGPLRARRTRPTEAIPIAVGAAAVGALAVALRRRRTARAPSLKDQA